jgi:hypothetical protein
MRIGFDQNETLPDPDRLVSIENTYGCQTLRVAWNNPCVAQDFSDQSIRILPPKGAAAHHAVPLGPARLAITPRMYRRPGWPRRFAST